MEPIIEIENGELKSLKIRQSLALRGKNRLRLQKLNVGIYSVDPTRSPIVIKDVIIGDHDQITDVDIREILESSDF